MSGISPDIIRNETKKRQKRKAEKVQKDFIKEQINKSIGYKDSVNLDSAKNLSTVKKEENLLGLLMIRPEFLDTPELSSFLSEEIFRCEFTKKVYRELVRDRQNDGMSTFGEVFSADEMGRITQMTVKRRELSNNSIEVAVELAKALKKISEDNSEDDFFKRIEELKKSKK